MEEPKKKRGRPAKLTLVVPVQAPAAPTAAEVLAEPLELAPLPSTYERICTALALTPEMTRKQRKISHWFKYIPGVVDENQEIIYEYLRGSDDEDVRKLLNVYDQVDYREKDFLSFEEYCAAAGVDTVKMLEKLVGVTVTQSDIISGIMAAMAHPQVLQNTIDVAKQAHGHREKKMLFQASGFLPRPKGAQTNITLNQANVTGQKGGGDSMSSLPSFDQEIRDLDQRMQVIAENKSKLLEGK